MPELLNITNIPSSRVDFIDPRTGLMSREWYRFFLNLFNLTGSGSNTDFETVADLVISNTNKGKKRFVDMPDDLKKQYQINTLADTKSLTKSGLDVKSFTKVHEGIAAYIDYLAKDRYY